MKFKRILALSLVALSTAALPGCKKKNKGGGGESEVAYFSFSIGLQSGANTVDLAAGETKTDYIKVFDNGVDTANRSYSYRSTNETVASIDQEGKVTFKDPGETPKRVSFVVTEANSSLVRSLKKEVLVTRSNGLSNGGYNYSGGTKTEDLEKRAEILGKLEKYAMDSHLTGITLFDNGGYVKYNNRVKIPTAGQEYIEGYGFGIITEGELDGNLTGDSVSTKHPDYYHTAMSQDSLKINQYSATGSLVGDLASYITASYWGTRLNQEDTSEYEWYPQLATEYVRKPILDEHGVVTDYEGVATRNSEPIPMEAPNDTKLYRKWRVYVKTGGNLKYKTMSNDSKVKTYNNRVVTIEDYEFAYQLLFTQSNDIIRGTEMANDTSYGIKGAKRYYNATKSVTDKNQIQEKWDEFKNSGKLGIKTGNDVNGDYLDLELINPIDSFTAMYTLSSSLVSPLPRSFFTDGVLAGCSTMKDSIKKYGLFNDGNIIDFTLCLGAFTLEEWTKNSEIYFARNNEWFEVSSTRYKIPGVYYRVINLDTDSTKNWKQFNAGNLDSAGVPSGEVEEQIGKEGVKATKGDATFKLNVNSLTREEWEKKFGPQGEHPADQGWDIKPWMSNQDFLDGLFYSIDRQAFAKKRGVTPSINYFSDAYQMRNSEGGSSYNKTQAHIDAVKGYSENYGYNFDKAVDCFRNAVQQLSRTGDIVLGTKESPTEISIHIRWMYSTDEKEYGEDIVSYFTKAFNNDAVCGGRVKLKVEQKAVSNWEDVYNKWMMQGCFDLGFGAISGNTYNPLNFMEVLKSDNSSNFTLNWGPDTAKVDERNPIIYDGKKWSYDALWEVADHGGIVEDGVKVDPVKRCYNKRPTVIGDPTTRKNELYEGFEVEIPTEFAEYEGSGSGSAVFDASRLDLYIHGYGNETLAEKDSTDADLAGCTIEYDRANKVIRVKVSPERAAQINETIINECHLGDDEPWKLNPFIASKLGEKELFEFELYYSLKIAGGSESINYSPVATA